MDEAFLLNKHGNSATAVQSASLCSIVENYIKYYASGNTHTSRAKKVDLDSLLTFLCRLRCVGKPQKLKVKDLDHSSIQKFIEDSLARGESPATVARRIATLKHFGRTLADRIAGFINPARDIKAPKMQPGAPKYIQKNEIAKIRRKAQRRSDEKDTFNRLRNRVIFELLLDTGLRAEEIRLLRFGQIDEKLEWIENVRTKGLRYRNVYITSSVRPLLADYLKARETILKKFYARVPKNVAKNLPLFLSTYSAIPDDTDSFLMGAKSVWRAIKELSTDTPLHPHLLRHSFATELLQDCNDIRLVAQALGHSDVRITMRYTERRDSEVAEALEKARRKS